MFTLELLCGLLRGFEGIQVFLDLNFLEHLLVQRIIAHEQFRLDQTNAGMLQDVLLVLGLDILVIHRLA